MKRPFLAALSLLLLCLVLLAGCRFYSAVPEEYISEGFHLGTFTRLKLFGPDKSELKKAALSGEALIISLENKFSANIASSDIGRLNRAEGRPVQISRESYELLERSLQLARETGGNFDPAIGDIVKLWKIGTPEARVPSEKEISEALKKTSYKGIRLFRSEGRFYGQLPKGTAVDLGAIAKGRVADLLTAQFSSDGVKCALTDLGGNLAVLGSSPKGEDWRLGLQHPDKPRGEYFGIVTGKDLSVVTSGPYERYFEKNGIRYHHIFDPKTGRPADSDLISVSVLDKDSTKADALCTALFVMGSRKASEFLARRPELAAVLVLAKGNRVLVTKAAQKLFRLTDESFSLQTVGGKEQ